jgi:hypothetical protein
MIYAKPQLVAMADARIAIQSQSDGSDGTSHEKDRIALETPGGLPVQSTAAYEADE